MQLYVDLFREKSLCDTHDTLFIQDIFLKLKPGILLKKLYSLIKTYNFIGEL